MLANLFALIPTRFKIVLGLAGALAIIGGLWGLHRSIDQAGYDRCQTEHTAALRDAQTTARAEIINLEKAYEAKIQDLLTAPGGDDPVGPLTTRVLDGMR